MKYIVLVSPKAHQEIEDAYDFYEEKREGLGERFLDEIDVLFHILTVSPLSYGFINDSKIVRDVNLDKFPFVIVFMIIGFNVNVMSVRHTLRKPFFG